MGLDLNKLYKSQAGMGLALDVLTFIAAVVLKAPAAKSAEALCVVKAALSALAKFQKGEVTEAKVVKELEALRKAVQSTDESAMDKLRKKFGR